MPVDPDKPKVVEGMSPDQVTEMEKEIEALQRVCPAQFLVTAWRPWLPSDR
jgi:hypothetical protein